MALPDIAIDLSAFHLAGVAAVRVCGGGRVRGAPERCALIREPSAGWLEMAGILSWSDEVSVVAKTHLTPELCASVGLTLPANLVDSTRFALVRRASDAATVVAVDGPTKVKLADAGVAVYTIGFDRTSGGLYVFGTDGTSVQGDLFQAIDASFQQDGTSDDIDVFLDGIVDRILWELTGHTITEQAVELAAALARPYQDLDPRELAMSTGQAASERDARLMLLEAQLAAHRKRGETLASHVEGLLLAVDAGINAHHDAVKFTSQGETVYATVLTQPELVLEWTDAFGGGQEMRLAPRERWIVTTSPLVTVPAPVSKPISLRVPVSTRTPLSSRPFTSTPHPGPASQPCSVVAGPTVSAAASRKAAASAIISPPAKASAPALTPVPVRAPVKTPTATKTPVPAVEKAPTATKTPVPAVEKAPAATKTPVPALEKAPAARARATTKPVRAATSSPRAAIQAPAAPRRPTALVPRPSAPRPTGATPLPATFRAERASEPAVPPPDVGTSPLPPREPHDAAPAQVARAGYETPTGLAAPTHDALSPAAQTMPADDASGRGIPQEPAGALVFAHGSAHGPAHEASAHEALSSAGALAHDSATAHEAPGLSAAAATLGASPEAPATGSATAPAAVPAEQPPPVNPAGAIQPLGLEALVESPRSARRLGRRATLVITVGIAAVALVVFAILWLLRAT